MSKVNNKDTRITWLTQPKQMILHINHAKFLNSKRAKNLSILQNFYEDFFLLNTLRRLLMCIFLWVEIPLILNYYQLPA